MNDIAVDIAHRMDAVAISPEHNFRDMQELVTVAKKYDLHLVYGLNCFYPYLLENLKGSNTIVGGGIASASTGYESSEQKYFLAELYQSMGCGEMDLYINIPFIRSGMEDRALQELQKLRNIIKCTMKVIIEAPALSDDQIRTAGDVVVRSGADFIKTGTGFLGPTTLEIVQKVKEAVGNKIQIKAAGGITGYPMVKAMLDMGVTRIGMGYKKVIKMMEELE